jgi:coproporphyrinogen III oxidase
MQHLHELLLSALPPQVHWSVEFQNLAMSAPERLEHAFTMTKAWLAIHSLP